MSELHIVTGKGGVGKTRVALLLSQLYSAELTERSESLKKESEKLEWKHPPSIHTFKSQDLLEEFLLGVLKIKTLAHFAAQSRLLQNIVRTAPNLDELLIFGKWVQLAKNRNLVVDGPSTGNLISYFDAIKTALRMFDGGVLHKIAEEIHSFLTTKGNCHVHLVCIPERSAIEEMNQIEEHLTRSFPEVSVHRVLNRKHDAPLEGTTIPIELQDLAFERPKREKKRIEGIQFDHVLKEGGLQF